MKTWLKKYGGTYYKYRRSIAVGIMIGMVFAEPVSFGVWKTRTPAPVPEVCSLCGNGYGPRYHAPALVNLSTDEVGELSVYDPDPQRAGELSEEQSTGTLSLLRIADLTGFRETCNHTSHVTLPKKLEPIDPAHFCYTCRELLATTATEGYILADLYDLGGIMTYAIVDGAEYAIRDYTVSISGQEGLGVLSVDVAGHLSTGA